MRYVPRLVPPGSVPPDALVEPLIANVPPSPLGEHERIPQVAWMVERDGAFVHVPASEHEELEVMRGHAMLTMLDGELANTALEEMPGVHLATEGEYAAELLLDRDHLGALHDILGSRVYLAGAPRRGRLLVGGVGAGTAGMRAFVARVKSDHDGASPAARISPAAMLVREGRPTAVVGELQIEALARAVASR